MSSLVILTPVYDDWESLLLLIPRLDRVLAANHVRAEVLVVDDASPRRPDASSWDQLQLEAIDRVRIVELIRNCGHQRAIALGLAYLEAEDVPDTTVVMDADGEDNPEDVPRLIDAVKHGRNVVFANRARRSERMAVHFFLFFLSQDVQGAGCARTFNLEILALFPALCCGGWRRSLKFGITMPSAF